MQWRYNTNTFHAFPGSQCTGLFSTTVLGGSSSAPNLQDYARSHGKKFASSLPYKDGMCVPVQQQLICGLWCLRMLLGQRRLSLKNDSRTCIFITSTVMRFIISQETVILGRTRQELLFCEEFYADVRYYNSGFPASEWMWNCLSPLILCVSSNKWYCSQYFTESECLSYWNYNKHWHWWITRLGRLLIWSLWKKQIGSFGFLSSFEGRKMGLGDQGRKLLSNLRAIGSS